MIVFIAPFPALSNEKDGMVQRVASIDKLVNELPRVYLDISLRRFWSKRIHHFGGATVFQLHGLLHFFFIISWLRRASIVYIHSVMYSQNALIAYWIAKPITDLHGVVPEESEYKGNRLRAIVYGIIELIALHRSSAVIYVTSAMKCHFEKKYGRRTTPDLIIPIIQNNFDERGQCENVLGAKRDSKRVIYAGGLQAWQNIAMMLDAAASVTQMNYVFLSGESMELQHMADSANVVSFKCSAVDPDCVPDHYLTCTYGFILRENVLVNRVACPTKLVEYMYWGVIPVVLTPNIGDFVELGYEFVTLDDFRKGHVPDDNKASNMRAINRQVAERLNATSEGELLRLRKMLHHA